MSLGTDAQRGLVHRYAQGDAALLVRRGWCKGCDLCVEACPAGILRLDGQNLIEVADIDACIFCGICAVRCPDFVFVLERPAARAAATPRRNGPEEPPCD
jgi:2-oxoglutarate ferredoxin oxidoreductase subunit delta